MALDVLPYMRKVADHCARTGAIDTINKHEPKSAPGRGMHAALWIQQVGPADSGLASTSAKVTIMLRFYQNALMRPMDAIDPLIWRAAGLVIGRLTADVTLDDTARCIDLLGHYGVPLSAIAGYAMVDQTMYRVVDVTIPVILNDVWEQVA
jgi:hypothetical protein